MKKLLWMFFQICAYISGGILQAQPTGIDSFFCHDQDKRLLYFDNKDYRLSFYKQKLIYASSADSVIRFDTNQQALFINPGSPSWVKIELRETGPWLISRDTVYELDSMEPFRPPHGSLGAIVGGVFQLNFKGIAFKIKYTHRTVDEMSFEVNGHFIQLYWWPYIDKYNLRTVVDQSGSKYLGVGYKNNLPDWLFVYNHQQKQGFSFHTLKKENRFDLIDFKPNPPGASVLEISPLFEYNRRGKLKRKHIPVHYCTGAVIMKEPTI